MSKLYNLIQILLIAICSFVFAQSSTAEDTEIYQIDADSTASGRPKVLIIFDVSSSMSNNVTVVTEKGPFDNTSTYSGSFTNGRIYWSESSTPPSSPNNQYISESNNRCGSSIYPLATVGQYTDYVQRWQPYRNRWIDFTAGKDKEMDCKADVTLENNSNPGISTVGYPAEPSYYTTDNNIALTDWGNVSYNFWTANYLNWYYSEDIETTMDRIEIAQIAISNLIISNPGIDFGLMPFNYNQNENYDGGRLVSRIIEGSDTSDRNAMITKINNFTPSGWTPLCETTYEAYRYFSGGEVKYGYKKHPTNDTTSRDTAAESGGSYISPATNCKELNIILITDGLPTRDHNANDNIKTLIGIEDCGYHGTSRENCLPELVNYMAYNDIDNDTTNGFQRVTTHTIGFGINAPILTDTAAACEKCTFTEVIDAFTLSSALTAAVNSILDSNESFTAPALVVDAFNSTESRNKLFFGMFKPSNSVNWKGNVKKLTINIENELATLIDADGNNAVDSSTGRISEDARTFWSSSDDGDSVEKGGVGALLAARDTSTRTLKTNTGSGDSLEDLTISNLKDPTLFGLSALDFSGLYSYFGVADEAAFDSTIKWAQGIDVDDDDEDNSITDTQPWILADMLHSKPVVVNYGGSDNANPDQRIIVGTNGGFLHMFGDSDGVEDWAFFPKELSPILIKRRTDAISNDHIYGIDAPLKLYTYDANRDGTIKKSDGDKVYVYFGLRRGGRIMYALDITDPDNPEFLWKISNSTAGFSELGQTWSVPVISTIPGLTYDHDSDAGDEYPTPEVPKPVLVFGAGYDTNKDATGVGTADSMGRGVFIVDALTGEKKWSYTSLEHSVPSAITPMDSNGDGISDRLYFGDTGGNVWRVDMPGADIGITLPWRITKLADLNDGTVANDRRFFNSPDVVRTKHKFCVEVFSDTHDLAGECKITSMIKYYAVMIGTGDRTNPNATDVSNQFYMIRDLQLSIYTTDRLGSKTDTCTTEEKTIDFRCNLPFNTTDLYDATSNIIQTGSSERLASTIESLESANGWRLDLTGAGEKSLSKSVTIYGSVYFTSFIPDDGLILSCVPLAGKGILYQVDLHDATAKRDYSNDGGLDRTVELGNLIPDSPAIHYGSDKKIRLLFPSGGGPSGDGQSSDMQLDSGAELPQPYAVYWYREEQ